MNAAAPPIKRTNNHREKGWKDRFKNEFDVMNVGLKMVLKTEATDMKATIAVIIETRYSPKTAWIDLAGIATGIVRSPW